MGIIPGFQLSLMKWLLNGEEIEQPPQSTKNLTRAETQRRRDLLFLFPFEDKENNGECLTAGRRSQG